MLDQAMSTFFFFELFHLSKHSLSLKNFNPIIIWSYVNLIELNLNLNKKDNSKSGLVVLF